MEDLSRYNADGTTLRKCQLRMLDMLIAVDKILRAHNISYWLDFGTLLGAVRHSGFIPWDDDIDISVLQTDYKKVREILMKELPEQFVFQDSTTDKYAFFTYGRVRDKKSYCYYPEFVKMKEQGLWLDIFIYDLIPSARQKNFVDFFYRRAYHEVHNIGVVKYPSKLMLTTKKAIAYIVYPFACIGVKYLRILAKLKKSNLYGRYSLTKHTYKKENIFPLREIEFEGHYFLCPNNYDAHLRSIYGDYMQIPHQDKREQILDMSKVKFYS